MNKILIAVATAGIIAISTPLMAFAHVEVTPEQANAGESMTFTVNVPNERADDVTTVKLDIPKGVVDVMPIATKDWTITTEKSDNDVSSITWTGSIPTGQRGALTFVAQAPAKTGDVIWKAYETYADGTVASWSQDPSKDEVETDTATTGPWSVTAVADDLSEAATTNTAPSDEQTGTIALVLSIVAVLFSAVGLLRRRRQE